MILSKQTSKGIETLVYNCGNYKLNESILIIFDNRTEDICLAIEEYLNLNSIVTYKFNQTQKEFKQPNEELTKLIINSNLVICLTTLSLAHTNARKLNNELGNRFLSLPDYHFNILSSNSMNIDFTSFEKEAKILTEKLNKSNTITITTESGTNISASLKNRNANCAPGFVNDEFKLGSPPDAEVNIAPIEKSTNGVIIVDGSITCEGLRIINNPIKLNIEEGKIVKIEGGKEADILKNIFNSQEENAKIIGEIGIGLNPNAKISGYMLEDEGCRGTVHFGIGSNSTIGGNNIVNFHLDHCIQKPTIIIDNEMLLNKGIFTI